MNQDLLFAAVLLLTSSCVTLTSPEKMSDDDLTQEVLAYAGLETSFETLPEMIKASLASKKKESTLSAEVFLRLEEAVTQAFDIRLIRKNIFDAVKENLSTEEKIAIVAWYRSDLGLAVRKAEVESETLEGQIRFQKWLKEIENRQATLSDEEVSFASQIVQQSGSLRLAVEMIASMSVGMVIGLNASQPKEKKLSEKKLTQQVETIKMSLAESLAPTMILTTHFAYADLDDEKKSELLGFLQNENGQRFTSVINESLATEFHFASLKVGKFFGESSFAH